MNSYSRRDFTKLSLAALLAAPASRLLAAEKPNSKWAGVQIGLNAPYSFAAADLPEETILQNLVQLGLSGVELRAQPVEVFLGAEHDWIFPKKGGDKETAAANAQKLHEWRATAPVEKAKEFRAKWENAGVLIEIVKVDGIFKMSDAETDYAFNLAKALGARAISTEISHTESELQRVGSFADKHQLMVGYHGHATTTPEHWEAAFKLAKFNGANVDLGHFVAGNNTSPVPFLKQYHERVTHVHLKDRKMNNGGNTPWGEGDTPIAEVLRLIRDQKWNIQGTIEFEYKIPEGSDRMQELAKQVKFCKETLLS